MDIIQSLIDKDYATSILLLIVVWFFIRTIKELQEKHNASNEKIVNNFIKELNAINSDNKEYHKKEMEVLNKISVKQDQIYEEVKK
jgi:hypothetical protein